MNYNAGALICGGLKDRDVNPFTLAGWKRLLLRLAKDTSHLCSSSRADKTFSLPQKTTRTVMCCEKFLLFSSHARHLESRRLHFQQRCSEQHDFTDSERKQMSLIHFVFVSVLCVLHVWRGGHCIGSPSEPGFACSPRVCWLLTHYSVFFHTGKVCTVLSGL